MTDLSSIQMINIFYKLKPPKRRKAQENFLLPPSWQAWNEQLKIVYSVTQLHINDFHC